MLTGVQLRLLRQARGLMQKELAGRMNIAQQRLSILEKSKNSISDTCARKALNALKFTKKEAMKFLNNIPSPAGE